MRTEINKVLIDLNELRRKIDQADGTPIGEIGSLLDRMAYLCDGAICSLEAALQDVPPPNETGEHHGEG